MLAVRRQLGVVTQDNSIQAGSIYDNIVCGSLSTIENAWEAAVVSGLDLSNAAFPYMSAAAAHIAGIAGRVFRISFSGELAYELAVPAQHARSAWSALRAKVQTKVAVLPGATVRW